MEMGDCNDDEVIGGDVVDETVWKARDQGSAEAGPERMTTFWECSQTLVATLDGRDEV